MLNRPEVNSFLGIGDLRRLAGRMPMVQFARVTPAFLSAYLRTVARAFPEFPLTSNTLSVTVYSPGFVRGTSTVYRSRGLSEMPSSA
jgi:hypothetical protein